MPMTKLLLHQMSGGDFIVKYSGPHDWNILSTAQYFAELLQKHLGLIEDTRKLSMNNDFLGRKTRKSMFPGCKGKEQCYIRMRCFIIGECESCMEWF